MGRFIVKANATKALYYINQTLEEDMPNGLHTFAEVLHLRLFEIPKTYIQKYNLTTRERRCEVSL
jgi:hypothetical protein